MTNEACGTKPLFQVSADFPFALSRMVAFLALLPAVALASDIPLDRDPRSYFLIGLRTVRIFSAAMEPPGCNVGVNCWSRSGRAQSCGLFHANHGTIPAPGQIAANRVCGTRSFFQVFANLPPCVNPTCEMIGDPGAKPDCTDSFTLPILGDLDHDGTPSCDDDCVTDRGDIAVACGATLPLPACNPGLPIDVMEGQDCSLGDAIPGNGRCDLGTGAWGAVHVGRGARLDFAAGTTVICSLKVFEAARVTSDGAATVLLPGSGSLRFRNFVDVGGGCGALRFVTESGLIQLGRYGDFSLDVCTIAGQLRLGQNNNLRGHFIADKFSSGIKNDARCGDQTCLATTTSTSTSTSSTTMPSMTSSSTTTSTTTTASSTATTAAPTTTSSSTTTSAPAATTTTSTPAPTTTTTLGGGRFTRTPGFYKNHPAVTQSILSAAGGVSVCGYAISDADVDDGHSALEALCVDVQGDQRVQLVRQLVTAALNLAAGGAPFADFARCNALCQDGSATVFALAVCIDETDAYNNSGDVMPAPFDPPGPADPGPCVAAFATACTVAAPSSCTVP